ncbi:Hypothetical predicted protein [Paramuricea clavata]|uniref:Uncharacterized protein n=1 Tax=Paramuricea clavata TaxID=317549 RepID=A0A6S7FVH6_PARCT|nr:Hypothetical predicted protein [Paramuricea clavata]
MLSVIASIISSALGLVLNKARTTATDKLKDGDITDEKLRDVINEDLNDIKAKLDALSRKDLLASYCFLKEGVVSLNLALDEAKDEQTSKDDTNGDQNGGSRTTAATTRNESESGVLNEAIALSHAIQKLNNTSNARLVSAKECFKAAREKATEAFCNEALSLPDRIMAVKLRVVSKILECLQDTKVAADGCMLFLEELHNLPIGETFSTYFKGGIKSRFYKDSRLENVKSVLSLNFAISEFVARFSGELPNVRNWPRIHLSTRETIHPLLLDVDVVKDIFDKDEFQPPGNQIILSKIDVSYTCIINSKGQLLTLLYDEAHVLNGSGETKTFCRILSTRANLEPLIVFRRVALVIDRDDKVFVIKYFKDCTSGKCVYVLFVFDSSGNRQYERVLHFLKCETAEEINCVINNDGDIIIHFLDAFDLYVCDNSGNLKSTLSLEKHPSDGTRGFFRCASVTNQNEIVMIAGNKVFVYTKEGKLKRTIIVKSRIAAVTFNYATSNLEIMEYGESFGTRLSFCIRTYSENDEVGCLYLPINEWYPLKAYCSHPTGPAAFIYRSWSDVNKIIFL